MSLSDSGRFFQIFINQKDFFVQQVLPVDNGIVNESLIFHNQVNYGQNLKISQWKIFRQNFAEKKIKTFPLLLC